ncbi:hypothetical protein BJV82DRAFT_635015 [Fennellomyces sp. T-0311]|nr:hypothetical protein BJV82DRAFT_635015 [Fennellomyces sp. T-0311]
MPWPGSLRPMVYITLPPPIIVQAPVLVTLYWAVISADYAVLRNEKKLPLSKAQLRTGLAIVHTAIPLVIASASTPANLFYLAFPWFYAAYSAAIPVEKYSYQEWLNSSQYLTLEASDEQRMQLAERKIETLELTDHERRNARIKGVKRMVRGACKLAVMKLCVDPLFPDKMTSMLTLPWLHPTSLGLTALFGAKAYCFLGVADVFMGLQQVALGVPTSDLNHSPMFASSPKEFWSRRWNAPIRNLMHMLIFSQKSADSKKDADGDRAAARRSRMLRGLLVYFISGLYHELIIVCLFRQVSLENVIFFTLHGVIVLAEVVVREKTGYKQELVGWQRVVGIACTLTTLVVTGRMFLAPFLRYFSA